MQTIHQELDRQSGIGAVETNAATGSVVVHYDPERRSTDEILGILRDVGVIVRDVARTGGEELPEFGHSTTSKTILEAFSDLDRRVSRATGRKVDLKLLFPLGLGTIGIWQVLRAGFGFSEIPGYILLWYAFDSFHKLHIQIPSSREETIGETADRRLGAQRSGAHEKSEMAAKPDGPGRSDVNA